MTSTEAASDTWRGRQLAGVPAGDVSQRGWQPARVVVEANFVMSSLRLAAMLDGSRPILLKSVSILLPVFFEEATTVFMETIIMGDDLCDLCVWDNMFCKTSFTLDVDLE